MWTRGWTTSLPRGSSQRSCRKHRGVVRVLCTHPAPWHTSRISPALQMLLVPVGKTPLLMAGTQHHSKGKAGGRGLGYSCGVQDAGEALGSVPWWGAMG